MPSTTSSSNSSASLSSLFTPIRIGGMELKNRIVMAPMTVDYANPDETPSEQQIAYYAERAKGGVGLIGLEVVTVDAKHRYQQRSLGLHSDSQIAGHKKLVDAIHAFGAKVQPQLAHTGPESLAPFYEGMQPIGPSVVLTQTTRQACREASIEELEAIIEMYGDAARRAREAGYDGIELHSAHSYMLLGSFLSPLRNLRRDDYAGHKFEGRSKLLLQVLDNIRAKAGEDFPITIRLSGFERESGGREINDTQRLAPLLVKAGVSCFHVSGGVGDANITQLITGPEYRPAFNLGAAMAIKQVVDVPVMSVGQNMDPQIADDLIRDGKIDLVVMGRALLADPALPAKASKGQLQSIRGCTLCQDCVDIMMAEGQGVKCAVNPFCGRELSFPEQAAAISKKVLIIGGGPAGMAAAEAACRKGHQVTLIEQQNELGGAFKLASTVFPSNRQLLDYLIHQTHSLPIELKLGECATAESIGAAKPDVIIVASGGKPASPAYPGSEADHVISGAAVLNLIEQIRLSNSVDELPLGNRIVIIGADLISMELAETLARLGKQVHILEESSRYGSPIGKKRRNDHAKRLDQLGVPINTGVNIEEITRDGVSINNGNGYQHVVKGESVIVIPTLQANTTLYEQLSGLADQVASIGDCTGFGLSKKALKEAVEAIYAL